MRPALAVVLAAVSVGFAGADPPSFEVPAVVRGEPGRPVFVTPKTDAASVVYVPLDALVPFPADRLKDHRDFVAFPASKGRYRFVAVAASKTGEQASFDMVVQVGDPDDAPPKPKPGPPDPKPDPDSPSPDKALVEKFRTAVAADGDSARADAAKLAAAYRKAAASLTRPDSPVKTVGQAYSAAFSLSVGEGVPRLPRLQYTRGVVNTALPKATDSDPADTTESRARLAGEFLKIAAAIEESLK